MRLNPIVKKDVKVQSRSMKICWGVFAYELILALVFFFAMTIIQQESRYSMNNIYSAMVWLYPVLAVTQLVILGVVVPVRTASSISGEKERQTFDIMMTTSMTPFSIIAGKVTTAIVQSMLFVLASMPVMALSFIIGGMSWAYLLWFLGIALLVSLFAASIGILCSALCKKSISAVIMSYGFYLFFFIVTVLPLIVYEIIEAGASWNMSGTQSNYIRAWLCLFLMLNPIVYIVDFFAHVMMGESWAASILDLVSATQPRGLFHFISSGYVWMILSTVLYLAISALFLFLAARRINPVGRHVRRAAKKSGGKSK